MATPTLVQHSAFCGSDGNLFTAFKCLMPNAVLSGNLVIVAILTRIAGGGGINPTIADDKSNTYTAGPTITTSTNKKLHTFFLWNVTNGPRIWTISYTGTGESMDGCAISEYYNVQTSSNPLRTNSTTTNAGGANPTLTSAALTPTTGDLLWYFGFLDDTTQADTYLTEMTSWTPDSANGMRLLHGDLRLFHAVQDKIASSGSSQTNTLAAAGATDGWAVAVLDFISAAAGTAPAVGAVHVIKTQH